MSQPPPSPTEPRPSPADVLLDYLEYFRSLVLAKLDGLGEPELRSSRLPTGWSPLELLQHLVFMEQRWLVWGFLGREVADPWGDRRDHRWSVAPDVGLAELSRQLAEQATFTRQIVETHPLDAVGQPSDRWSGDPPPTLERVLLHVFQEYARHAGHLDIVRELIDGRTGE